MALQEILKQGLDYWNQWKTAQQDKPHRDYLPESREFLESLLSRLGSEIPTEPDHPLIPSLNEYQAHHGEAALLLMLGHIHEEIRHDVPQSGQSRLQGSVYTPHALVERMLQDILLPILNEQSMPTDSSIDSIKLPRILDPACGCGAFLLVAAEFIMAAWLQKFQQADRRMDAAQEQRLRLRILHQSLHGCDIDADSLGICRFLLLSWAGGNEHEPTQTLNLWHANALSGPSPGMPEALSTEPAGMDWIAGAASETLGEGFDLIVGNPPYVDSESLSESSREFRKFARRHYQVASGNWDLYILFFERAISLLREGGSLSLVVPSRAISADYAAALQEFLLQYRLESIHLASNDTFHNARVWPVVIHVSLKHPSGLTRFTRSDSTEEFRVSRDLLQEMPAGYWSAGLSRSPSILLRLMRDYPALSTYASVCDGCSTSEAYVIRGMVSDNEKAPGFKLTNTGTLDRWASLWGRKKCRYLGLKLLHPIVELPQFRQVYPRRATQASSPKLLLAGLARNLECFADVEGRFLCGKSAIQVIPDDKESLHYLNGLLNSRILNWIYQSMFGLRAYSPGSLNIGPRQLELLPIPHAGVKTMQEISSVSMQLQVLAIQEIRGHEEAGLEKRINEIVDELYGVDSAKLQGMWN